jgi:hypothetical protein
MLIKIPYGIEYIEIANPADALNVFKAFASATTFDRKYLSGWQHGEIYVKNPPFTITFTHKSSGNPNFGKVFDSQEAFEKFQAKFEDEQNREKPPADLHTLHPKTKEPTPF